jgi:hypothetical protein
MCLMVRRAQDAKEHQCGQFPGEIPHEVCVAVAQTLSTEANDKFANEILHLSHALGVKATLASLRTRVCAGGSTLSAGTAPNRPSSRALAAIGQGVRRGELMFVAENNAGVRRIRRTSP